MKLSSFGPLKEHKFIFIFFVMGLWTIIKFKVNNSELIFVLVIIVEFVIKF